MKSKNCSEDRQKGELLIICCCCNLLMYIVAFSYTYMYTIILRINLKQEQKFMQINWILHLWTWGPLLQCQNPMHKELDQVHLQSWSPFVTFLLLFHIPGQSNILVHGRHDGTLPWLIKLHYKVFLNVNIIRFLLFHSI